MTVCTLSAQAVIVSKFTFFGCSFSSSMPKSWYLNSTALGWTAAIVRNGGNIPNECNFQSCSLKCADSGFSTCSWPTYHYLNLAHSLIYSSTGCTFSSSLRCKGSSLFCSLKTARTSAGPGDDISILIGNGDNAIVESRLDVGHPAGYVPFLLLAPGFFSWLSRHTCLVDLR